MAVDRQAQIDALETALATGVKTISVDGQTVTYASIEDMQKALRYLKRQVEIEGGKVHSKPPLFSMNSTLRSQC